MASPTRGQTDSKLEGFNNPCQLSSTTTWLSFYFLIIHFPIKLCPFLEGHTVTDSSIFYKSVSFGAGKPYMTLTLARAGRCLEDHLGLTLYGDTETESCFVQ